MTGSGIAERDLCYDASDIPRRVGTASADPEDFPPPVWRRTDVPSTPMLRMPCKAVLIEASEGNCRLRQPIALSLSWDGSYFYVENESLGHYGVGVTPEEAAEEMFHSMCVVYSAYRETPEGMLDAGARELLAMHERILEKAH